MLSRRTPLRRKKPMRRKNATRAREREHTRFGAPARVARALPCCVWTCRAPAPSQAAHYRSRGAGGKADACVSLCARHHREQEASLRAFEAKHRFKTRGPDGALVLCETLQEVASYIADLVRDHVCADTPELPKGRKRPRCYVCHARLDPSALEDLRA